jgi:hypothetical protein
MEGKYYYPTPMQSKFEPKKSELCSDSTSTAAITTQQGDK